MRIVTLRLPRPRITTLQLLLSWSAWILFYVAALLFTPRFSLAGAVLAEVLLWVPGIAALILCVIRAFFSGEGKRAAWGFLTVGVAMLLVGDLLRWWAMNVGTDLAAPLLFVSHGFHLLFYPLALLAVLYLPGIPRAGFRRLVFGIDLVIYSVAWGLLLWALLVYPFLQVAQTGPGSLFWAALFPTLYLVLLMLVVWWQGQAERALPELWVIAPALLFLAAYSLVSGWLLAQGYNSIGSWVDILWLGGYGLIAASTVSATARSPRGRKARAGPFRRRWQQVENRWLPLASGLALLIYVLTAWRQFHQIQPAALWGAVSIFMLLILREGILAGQAELAGYATLVHNLGDPSFICNPDGKLLLQNPILEQALGSPGLQRLQEFISLPEGPPEGGGRLDEILRQARNGGWQGEVTVGRGSAQDRKGARKIWPAFPPAATDPPVRASFPAWLILRPLSEDPGGRARLAGLLHDLSPQQEQERVLEAAYREAEEARQQLLVLKDELEARVREQTSDLSHALSRLEEQNQELRSLDRLKSEFVALTSHELRSPLATIQAGLELSLTDSRRIPTRVRTTLDLVRKESQRLSRFVEGILNLSALEAGRLPVQALPLEVGPFLRSLASSLVPASPRRSKENRLELHVEADLPEVVADEQMLTSALFHLIDNAFKYAPAGPIQLRAVRQGERVEISVGDQGPGLSPSELKLLFQMFSRLENPDAPRVRGYGLGLYMSKRFVEAMGGEITAASAPGQGLTVSIRLPALKEEP
jgi:signal transduction histidine kinase